MLTLEQNQPGVYELHLREFLSKSVTRCQGSCGKKIDQKDTMLIKSYGTMRWTDKKTGKKMSKHGPMYIHFNEHCLRKFDNKKFYAPDESFDYSVITLCQETLTVLNKEERSLLRKRGWKV